MVRLALARLRRLRPVLGAVLAGCFALSGVAPLEPAPGCGPPVPPASAPSAPHAASHAATLHRSGGPGAGMPDDPASPAPSHHDHGRHQECCLASACCVGAALGTAVALVPARITAVGARAPRTPAGPVPAHAAHVLPFATAPPLLRA